MARPLFLGMFHRQIAGDEALLALAGRRFAAAGLGAEFYPGSPDELRRELAYRPGPGPYTAHLPRGLRLLDASAAEAVLAFAAAAGGARGLVVHDQGEVAHQFGTYVQAVKALDRRLADQGPGPLLFVEYAAGLEPATFVALFEALRDCRRVGACIDVSHVGIRRCQRAFAAAHPGRDVCHLKPDHAEFAALVEDVQAAVATALPTVLAVVEGVGRLGKPTHFHLHDGHPASTFSAHHVSDHLAFDVAIPVTQPYRGRCSLPLMFGPFGLRRIVQAAKGLLPAEALSFTLEIHPQPGRLLLPTAYGELFKHWRDLGHAEQMNQWIEVLLRNYQWLEEAWEG
jgi:hypothetical protein